MSLSLARMAKCHCKKCNLLPSRGVQIAECLKRMLVDQISESDLSDWVSDLFLHHSDFEFIWRQSVPAGIYMVWEHGEELLEDKMEMEFRKDITGEEFSDFIDVVHLTAIENRAMENVYQVASNLFEYNCEDSIFNEHPCIDQILAKIERAQSALTKLTLELKPPVKQVPQIKEIHDEPHIDINANSCITGSPKSVAKELAKKIISDHFEFPDWVDNDMFITQYQEEIFQWIKDLTGKQEIDLSGLMFPMVSGWFDACANGGADVSNSTYLLNIV
jgi:hypothetical protein